MGDQKHIITIQITEEMKKKMNLIFPQYFVPTAPNIDIITAIKCGTTVKIVFE